MRAMILAAGRGERLRPITDETPKPLIEVGRQTLLERHLENLKSAGIATVVINLGWLGDRIAERVGDGSQFGLEILYSQEGDNILETGGGIHKALPMLGGEPFLVVNGDIYTDMPIPDVHLDSESLGHLVLVPTPAYRDSGDFNLEDGLIRNGANALYTFSGVAFYRPEFFADCEAGRFSIAPMLRKAADSGKLSGSLYEGLWADAGTPDRLKALRTRVS